jgi:probable DNA metabolism protein
MYTVRLEAEDDFDGWRSAARALATAGIATDQIFWQVGNQSINLFADDALPPPTANPILVPKEFIPVARYAILHRIPERFSLLYALLLRVLNQPEVLNDRADRQMRRVQDLLQSVRRDIHKMRAFVRFRELTEKDDRRFVAWFEPEHYILRTNAKFFVDRFANMRWSILTPLGSIHWDGNALSEGPPAQRRDAPGNDPIEDIWKTYYAAIFNPSRLMTDAMVKEMPKKFWKNMPETALIPELIAGARKREIQMIDRSRMPPVPKV